MPRSAKRTYDFGLASLGSRIKAGGALAAILMSVCAYQLDSGLPVAISSRIGSQAVSISAWVGSGTADEPADRAGLAHFVEHMLFKGTTSRGVGAITSELEAVGGDINAWTTFDNIVVQLRVPPSHVDLGIDVLADMLLRSTFEASELELERDVILDELDLANADPQRSLGRALFSAVFRQHPYRRAILGSERSISKINRADVERFAAQAVAADNLAIAIAGDINPEPVKRAVARGFADLRGRSVRPRRPRLRQQRRPRERLIHAPVTESQLILAFPSPPQRDRDHLLLDMVSIALGQGASSSLARDLEGESAIATSTGAYVHGFRDAGLFVATASCRNEDVQECAEALAAKVFASVTDELDESVLETVRNGIVCDSIYGRETVDGLAAALGSGLSLCGDPSAERQRIEWARNATTTDLLEAAARSLRPSRATLAAVASEDQPSRGSGRFARMLSKVGASARQVQPPTKPLVAPMAKPTSTKTTQKATNTTRRIVLPSGVTVVLHQDDSVPLVAAQATWKGGLRLESTATAGIGELLARTITRGCGDRSDDEMAQLLDSKAATLGGFSGRNSFGLRAEWIAGDTTGLDLLLECIVAPRFDPDIARRERERLLEEANARTSSPTHLAHRMFAEALYGQHPYALDSLGTSESLEALAKMPSHAARHHYESRYTPGELSIAIVGDIEPDAIIARLRAKLGALPARSAVKTVDLKAPKADAERERFAYLERSRAQLVVGFPGVALDDPDRHSVQVIAAILGGQGGRLFRELREKRGLVYRVGAHTIEGVEPGAFAIVTTSSAKHVKASLDIIREQLRSLQTTPVSADELSRAIRFLVGATTNSLQRRSNLAASLAFAETHSIGYQSVFDAPTELAKVSAADVQRVAQRLLDWDTAVISTVLPPAASPEVKRRARGVRRKLPKAAARKRSP